MYAIIRAGGKQAKVRSGDVIEVERIKGATDQVEFRPILVVDDDGTTVATPDALANASVTARILGEVKGDKIDIFKYKNKTGYRRQMGHRQTYTQLEITGIDLKKKKTTRKSSAAKTADEATADEAAAETAEPAPKASKAASSKASSSKSSSNKKASAESGGSKTSRTKKAADKEAASSEEE